MSTYLKTLRQFQEEMPKGFDSIAVDIVGFCNAKCKYCPAGNDLSNKGSYIDIKLYEHILSKLIEYKFYSEETNFHIYCLGEPCLHPQLNEILKVTNKYNIKTNISTNASVVPLLDKDGLSCVERILISMPGFSQSSYNKIHGFNFEKIKENILKLKEMVAKNAPAGKKIQFDMSYHIYQFNQDEIMEAREFCTNNNIRFAPNYAVLMDKNKCMEYVTNTMSYEELKDISKELFLGVLDEQISVSPRNYCDFQERFLSINEKGDIRICSSFKKDYEKNILCGNILNDPIDEIISKKYNHARCDQCIKAGLTLGKGYDCKIFPNSYFGLMKENEYLYNVIKNSKNDEDEVDKDLIYIRQVRLWEQEHYSDVELNKLLSILKDDYYDMNNIEKLVIQYGRFGRKTFDKLHDILANFK